MKLDDYINKNGMNYTRFSKLIGVSPQSVHHYAKGKSIPAVNVMRKIYQETDGLVSANDFYF